MAKRFDGVKRKEWRKRLGKYDGSGLTVAEFCRREHVSEASFYYWAKRIRQAGKGEATQRAQQKASSAKSSDEVPSDFVEVLVGDSIRVRMPTGRLDAVAALVRDLQAGCVDDAMTRSRFQRIQLTTPTTQS
jgi:hypothetical protein